MGVDDIPALTEFNLAPLAARRDIVMLGLAHRTILGKGPKQFQEYFKRDETYRLEDPRKTIGGEMVKRSALGLVAIYNLLPDDMKKAADVKNFQRELQSLMKSRAETGCEDWELLLSPRRPLEKINGGLCARSM